MTRKTTLTLAILGATFLSAPVSASSSLTQAERDALAQSALAALADLGYSASQFERIKVRVDDDEIDVDADGPGIDADLTFLRNGNGLGALIEGDIDDDTSGEERVYASGSWQTEYDYSDDRYEDYDDHDDDDPRSAGYDDDRYEDDRDDDDRYASSGRGYDDNGGWNGGSHNSGGGSGGGWNGGGGGYDDD